MMAPLVVSLLLLPCNSCGATAHVVAAAVVDAADAADVALGLGADVGAVAFALGAAAAAATLATSRANATLLTRREHQRLPSTSAATLATYAIGAALPPAHRCAAAQSNQPIMATWTSATVTAPRPPTPRLDRLHGNAFEAPCSARASAACHARPPHAA